MSKHADIFNFLRQCPQLNNMWSIAGSEKFGSSVIIPNGTSERYMFSDSFDVVEGYEAIFTPYPSITEEYQINCFRFYDTGDSTSPQHNINVMTLDEVQDICNWIFDKDQSGELPQIEGEKVVSIECSEPQIRGVNEDEAIMAYFINVKIRLVNKAKPKSVRYDVN